MSSMYGMNGSMNWRVSVDDEMSMLVEWWIVYGMMNERYWDGIEWKWSDGWYEMSEWIEEWEMGDNEGMSVIEWWKRNGRWNELKWGDECDEWKWDGNEWRVKYVK